MTAAPLLSLLQGMPGDADGAVFGEPWQAHAFALAVSLHQRELFTWAEWAAALSAQIAAAQAADDADLGDTCYRHWLAALETLVEHKSAGSGAELARCRDAWRRAAERTPHGHAIDLRAQDFER